MPKESDRNDDDCNYMTMKRRYRSEMQNEIQRIQFRLLANVGSEPECNQVILATHVTYLPNKIEYRAKVY